MSSTVTQTASRTTKVAAAQLAALPLHTTVAASGGSPTTSREPPGQWAGASGAGPSAKIGKPEAARKPGVAKATKFAAVKMAIRIPELARWIAAHPIFTFAEAAGASAPSPCSPTVIAYTLTDPRLGSALAELGCMMTAGGKNGYTVTAIEAGAKDVPVS